MSRRSFRTDAERLAWEKIREDAEQGAIHQLCCRDALEYPGACERPVTAGKLGIRVQQSTKEWAAFQSAIHFWADWDKALTDCWGVYRRAITIIGLMGPGPRGDLRSRELLEDRMREVYGRVLESYVWRQREIAAVDQLADKLHRRRPAR